MYTTVHLACIYSICIYVYIHTHTHTGTHTHTHTHTHTKIHHFFYGVLYGTDAWDLLHQVNYYIFLIFFLLCGVLYGTDAWHILHQQVSKETYNSFKRDLRYWCVTYLASTKRIPKHFKLQVQLNKLELNKLELNQLDQSSTPSLLLLTHTQKNSSF